MTEMDFLISPAVHYRRLMENADARTRNYALVWNSPVYSIVLTAVYLLFVRIGPHVLKKRSPLDVKPYMLIYNIGQVGLSFYMTTEFFFGSRQAGYNFVCDPYNDTTRKSSSELRIANVMWVYFISKAVDFFDTVFMILRKKDQQVTFLHVFHHVSMLNAMWCIVAFTPGGQPVLGALLNSLVHTIMYLYYGLSIFPSFRRYLWWKRHLTKLQLIQFFILLIHAIYSLYSACDYPRWAAWLVIAQLAAYIVLFANFFIQAYAKKEMRNGTKHNEERSCNGKEHIKES